MARTESSAAPPAPPAPGSTTNPGRTPGRYTIPIRTPRSMAAVSWARRPLGAAARHAVATPTAQRTVPARGHPPGLTAVSR
jgi:hypothetical protein